MTTASKSTPQPAPETPEGHPLPHDRFLNRELSWLAFNGRVLEEAGDTHLPLLERIKFLAISASNLDEFFMVRVAGLVHECLDGNHEPSPDGLSAEQQLAAVETKVTTLLVEQANYYEALKASLDSQGIQLATAETLTDTEREWLVKYLQEKVRPHLKPLIVQVSSKSREAPLFPNLSVILFHTLTPQKKSTRRQPLCYAMTPLPPVTPRLLQLPADIGSGTARRFIWLEDALQMIIKDVFEGYDVESTSCFRLLRDGWLELAEDLPNVLSTFESALKKRKQSMVIRLEVPHTMPAEQVTYLRELFHISHTLPGTYRIPLSLRDLMAVSKVDRPEFKFPQAHIRFPERIDDFGGDCFAAIAAKDIIVHHPYESFNVVVQFLRQAARDPEVKAIKQTLYRTSSDSPIVHALIQAAEAGKDVTVMVELKARFDEEANLQWGKDLEQAGARVVYGMPGLKTHSKLSMVVKADGQRYVHYGTGNYHPVNAKIYSDLSFFTCSHTLCNDAEAIFSFFEGKIPPSRIAGALEEVKIAPFNLQETLIALIRAEADYAKQGKPASIWIKVNSLTDPESIDALYEASRAGVSIDLVVRGICCLKPGVPGLSENIRVKSIVGRFLEHTRIYCFGDGNRLPHRKGKVYISSADLMQRNLKKRIELMVPITNLTVHEQVMGQIMVANLNDARQSWLLAADGSYQRIPFTEQSFCAHDYFMANPSLSGRGSALRKIELPKLNTQHETATKPVAVVDIGSNSVRMVIYDGLKRRPYPLYNEKTLCGLARDMETTGQLHEEGAKLALQALKRYMQLINAQGIDTVYAIATSAVRDSEDGESFRRIIEQQCNINVQVLTGKEEARLAALGVAASLYEADGVVGDLGGGSLELAQLQVAPVGLVPDDEAENGIAIPYFDSFPIGPLRLSTLSHNNIDEARDLIDDHLASFPLKKLLSGQDFYAVGGGLRALAKIHIARIGHPLRIIDHYITDPVEILTTIRPILEGNHLHIDSLKSSAGISEKRLETLSLVALVLERIIHTGQPERIMFSTYGVREGLLYDKLDQPLQREDPLRAGVTDMLHLLSPNRGDHFIRYGKELHEWMSPLFLDETHHMMRLRFAASMLSNYAWHEHTAYRAESSFRWVLDAEISGIDHWERTFIAACIYHRYKSETEDWVERMALQLIESKWLSRTRMIGLAMRFGYQLCGGTEGILPRTRLELKGKVLHLKCSKEDRDLIDDAVMKRFTRLADSMKLVPRLG